MKQHSKVAKQRVFAACVALVGICAAFAPAPPVLTLVLDAGHGGKDPGNLGTGRYPSTEKDITLDVTLQVGRYIEEQLPEVHVLYTRTDDSFPALHDRVRFANNAKADLFISIHCDAFTTAGAKGAGSYVMGMHKSEESLRVAMKENASMFKEENYEKHYDGFDPNDPDTYIALALRQNVNLDASLTLGAAIQSQFRERVGRKDRGVKQAGFYVISYTTMPSVLVELGFLTNPEEEDFLQSTTGKDFMASAIFRAFRDTYLTSRVTKEIPENRVPETRSGSTVNDQESDDGQSARNDDGQNARNDDGQTNPPKEADTKVADTPPSVHVLSTDRPAVWFGVQILTTEESLSPDSPQLRGHASAKAYIRQGLHKYVVGHHDHPDKAHVAKDQLRAEGFEGAFVVAFLGETQITMSHARELLNLPAK
ncbi:MAG: N-acetylmuramoyl-L-alanine amidase [Bacteroidetes bacterium]|nr:N-acetylmuramoyl-L-alanine amidase [Bacteroidota bacterium]MDA0903254.1 N-acetylmuramoyl-L-alanine amidase [Bacteroidota bacterium]MDA1242187.1 N-acetylmuramoyl-L-alanine amidase [Bacteroidota bacterium]